MLIDATEVAEGTTVESDVCIIGAGAAGITLARQLADRGHEVCLLESGGLDHEPEVQALYEGTSVGLTYPPLDRGKPYDDAGNFVPIGTLSVAVAY